MTKRGIVAASLVMAMFSGVTGTAQAAYPGTNGKIVYESKPDQFAGLTDPWTLTPTDPASAKRLVKIKENANSFAYSPNGKKIAFSADTPGSSIFVMKSSGKKPYLVTKKAKDCVAEKFPTWSPDGKAIAFQCLRDSGINDYEIYVTSSEGGRKVTRVTNEAESVDYLAWSPLGDRIAFEAGGGVVKTVPAGGGASTTLNSDAPGITGVWQRMDWSPNGTELVVESVGDGVYRMNALTGAVVSADLADGAIEPVFSPDGTKIAYTLFGDTSSIWTMDVAGTNKVQVTSDAYDRAPNWGPQP